MTTLFCNCLYIALPRVCYLQEFFFCGMQDSDLDDLAACLTLVGRDSIQAM